ncbi:MAG: hypothetical protein KatS3mg031_1683 [Chitinophagales bacterium]|nr:MAG: hypothetical protein KatS3mg031_1683 [Chitinophagales bacterium]
MSVSGNITFDKTSGNQADHRLLTDKSGSDSSFVVFNSGAVFHAKDFNGDPFGTSGPRNTFIFTSGSLYVKDAGNVPFGLNQPESKVVFQSGSTYQHKSGFPSFAGRSYGNFELNISGSLNISTGSAAGCSVENFTVTSGTLNFPMNANNTPQNFDITGTLSVASGATFNYSPSTTSAASLFRFTGSNGTIAGSGTIIFGSNSTLEFAGDVSIAGASVQVEGTVARKSGTVSVIGGGGMVYGANSALLYNGYLFPHGKCGMA